MYVCVFEREAQRDGVPIDWEGDRETNQCIVQVKYPLQCQTCISSQGGDYHRMLLLALLVMHMHTTCMNCPRPHPACAVLGEHCAKVMEVQR